MQEPKKCKIASLEALLVLQDFANLFEEIPGLQLKRDIGFYIDLMPRVASVFKFPYRMSTPELKELQM